MFKELIEYTYTDLMRKQRSVTKLFPTFYDRVKAVAARGGVRMVEMLPELWKFTVNSGTEDNTKYEVYLKFKNVVEVLKKYVPNKKLWKKDGSGVNYNLLAAETLNMIDMETSCSCPATLYWGKDFIRTQKDAQYGRQEDRPPNIRNPKQYGAMCKHGELMFEVLPMYTSTFASYLKKFYSQDIENLFALAQKEKEQFKAAGEELGKMAQAQAEEEPIKDLPPEEPEVEEPVTPELGPGAVEDGEGEPAEPIEPEEEPELPRRKKPRRRDEK